MNTLQELFTAVLNMSITASYVALVVILIRLALRKSPKIFSYALWAVVLFRLICPLSFTSAFSFLGLLNLDLQNNVGVAEYVPHGIGLMQTPAIQSGIGSVDNAINASLPQAAPIASVNPMQIWMAVLSLVWFAGIIVLLFYSVISYIKIKRRLQTATLVQDNLYESDQIDTAFVCGFLHPKIYVPVGVGDWDLFYILEHEYTHIRRRDYLIKLFAFLALILHWFNPLMWLCYFLMSKDMEMSCDESVIKKTSEDIRRNYADSLLSLSMKKSGLISPLAFGESNVKSRIKNVLNYKRPVFWISAVALMAVLFLTVPLISNPVNYDVPKIYIHTENAQRAEAIIGTYGWDFGHKKVQSDSVAPTEFRFAPENIITVNKGQQIILSNQKLNKDKKVPFTLKEISYWDTDMVQSILNPDLFTFHNGDLYMNAPEKDGEYVFGLHLGYERGNVIYGFKVAVTNEAPMKGLEVYVWKNRELTGNNDTYYTLLLGTNRNKEESEIYDLNIAVNSIEQLNEILAGYSSETEMFIYQMNPEDFTKTEMLAISDKIKFPSGNGSKAIGLWQKTTTPQEAATADTIEIVNFSDGQVEIAGQN